MGSDLAEKIHEIESTTQASLNEVKGSSESLDLRLASLEEMLAEMSQGSERTRVEIVGGTVGPRSEVNNEEALVLAPKDWRELVGRFMELEVAVRSEDSGLEMRVEILEGIAEEQGFSVRWEGDSDSQSSSLTMGMGQEIDMHELI
jgi:predicted secreted hydrolase